LLFKASELAFASRLFSTIRALSLLEDWLLLKAGLSIELFCISVSGVCLAVINLGGGGGTFVQEDAIPAGALETAES
jgi:hypothetical protein